LEKPQSRRRRRRRSRGRRKIIIKMDGRRKERKGKKNEMK